jgi:hypothetical protein
MFKGKLNYEKTKKWKITADVVPWWPTGRRPMVVPWRRLVDRGKPFDGGRCPGTGERDPNITWSKII